MYAQYIEKNNQMSVGEFQGGKRKRSDDETPTNKRMNTTTDIADAFDTHDSSRIENAMSGQRVRVKQGKKYGPKAGWELRCLRFINKKFKVAQDPELRIYDPKNLDALEKFPASIEVFSNRLNCFKSLPDWFILDVKKRVNI